MLPLNNITKYYKRFTANIILAIPYIAEVLMSNEISAFVPEQYLKYWWVVMLLANLYMNRRKKEVKW